MLREAMYETRDAAQNWEAEYTEMLSENGFVHGKHSACIFFREQKKVRIAMRGDDFTALGFAPRSDTGKSGGKVQRET